MSIYVLTHRQASEQVLDIELSDTFTWREQQYIVGTVTNKLKDSKLTDMHSRYNVTASNLRTYANNNTLSMTKSHRTTQRDVQYFDETNKQENEKGSSLTRTQLQCVIWNL